MYTFSMTNTKAGRICLSGQNLFLGSLNVYKFGHRIDLTKREWIISGQVDAIQYFSFHEKSSKFGIFIRIGPKIYSSGEIFGNSSIFKLLCLSFCRAYLSICLTFCYIRLCFAYFLYLLWYAHLWSFYAYLVSRKSSSFLRIVERIFCRRKMTHTERMNVEVAHYGVVIGPRGSGLQ
jgi:hypothetical protein